MSKLSNNIKMYRLKNGYTQAELAKMLNCEPAAVSIWESGRFKPRLKKLEEMSQIFGVPVAVLLGDVDEQNKIAALFNQLSAENKQKAIDYILLLIKSQF